MQHLNMNNDFYKLKTNNSTHAKDVNSSRNVKIFIKSFKHNCKILNCMCFGML